MSRESTARDVHTYAMRTDMNPYIVDMPTKSLWNPLSWGKSKDNSLDGSTPPLSRIDKALQKLAMKAKQENKNALDKANQQLQKIQRDHELSQSKVDALKEREDSLAHVLTHANPKPNPGGEQGEEE